MARQIFQSIQQNLSLQVLLALLLGALAGSVLAEQAQLFKPLGSIFLNAIKLLVAPLIFFALVSGILSLQGQQQLGRLAAKTVGLFLFTALLASALGLLVGTLAGFEANPALSKTVLAEKVIPPFSQVLVDLVPSNFLAPFVGGNVLQIIVLAILTGLALNNAGEAVAPIRQFVTAGSSLMFALTQLVLKFTPVGVFGLIAATVGQYGLAVLLPLGSFIVAVYVGCLLHIFGIYGALVKLGSRMSLRDYFRAILPAQLVAFSTASSYGTLPVTYKVVTEKLKVSRSYASFVLPLGSTINMDGCGGIYPAIAAIFIAKLYGIDLDALDYLLIAGTATVASLGTAGVPGTALVMLTVTLTVVGLPLEGIAFIAAVDRIVDMIRTTTNVSGDMAVALVVAESEGLIESTDRTVTTKQQLSPQTAPVFATTDGDAAFAAALAQGQDLCAIPTTRLGK
ncbi:dicarboxylate/amino acid:cation symporter [Rheinheimera texasensis]|uniref:dicarboxylate/amino acid:cation symporter n=1 Tax=Rheinheimera texasensis TaxID=306205 RepID=UPI0032B1F96D